MANTLSKNATEEHLVDVALKIAETKGWASLTREAIAQRAPCSTGIVSLRFGTMDNMRRTVMRAAVKREVLAVIAHGLVTGDKHARKAPAALQQRALASMAKSPVVAVA